MEKGAEFYRKKEEHRKEMRKILPPELQLEFPQKRPEKEKWLFEKNLLKLRESQKPEDRLFVEILRMKIKERLNKKITQKEKKEINELQKETKKSKEVIGFVLEVRIFILQGLDDEDRDIRRSALEQIQYLSEEERKNAILQGLSDKRWNVRCSALEQIQYLSKEERKNAILQGLSDENWMIRCSTFKQIQYLSEEERKNAILQGLSDKRWNVRCSALEQIQYLSEEERKNVIFQGLSDENWMIRCSALEQIRYILESIDSSQISGSLNKILNLIKKISPDHLFYSQKIISSLLRKGQDLGQFSLEYLPQFETIKSYSQEINQKLPLEKQTDNTETFWQKHQLELAKLHSLSLNLSTSWLTGYLKNFGFPRLERFLENIVKPFRSEVLKEPLAKIKEIEPEHFIRLIEISFAYQRMNLEEKLEKILKEKTSQEIESKELIKILGRNLLKEFVQKLKIEAKIKENAFDRWNLEYLPKLFTAEAQYESESKEFLKVIMKTSFQEESFLPSLFGQVEGEYTEDEKEYLKEIKEYNLKVKKEFEKNGLDFENWLNYREEKKFKVGASHDQLKAKRRQFENELTSAIKELLGSWREKKEGILSKEETKLIFDRVIKAYGIQFKEEGLIHPQKGKFSIKDIGIILNDFYSEIEKIFNQERDRTKKENIGTALSHLKGLIEELPDLEKELLRKGFELEIRIWQREPGYDIFQGNYTRCCVAVENFNRAAMLDYLVDTNLQVVEIRDKIEDKTIAQAWLFIAEDSQNNLNLILDSVEINSDYSGLEPQIKESLFAYLKEYTKAFSQGKIKRILLGASSYNDIETEDMNSVSLSQTKLAGCPRETQYLDAFGSAWVDPSKETLKSFFVVAEDLEKPIEKSKGGRKDAN